MTHRIVLTYEVPDPSHEQQWEQAVTERVNAIVECLPPTNRQCIDAVEARSP